MKIKELRIGNLVKFGEDVAEIIEIQLLRKPQVGIILENGDIYRVPVSYVEPIPFTEEWLLKLESEKSSLQHSLKISIPGFFFCISSGKYVHQLQNLYYALTNEELTQKN